MSKPQPNRRILLIDDNPSIHEDFKKILAHSPVESDYTNAKASLFGSTSAAVPQTQFEIDSAYQGQQGLELIAQAENEGRPYAMAFVDVRMPPGLDGIETIYRIWEKHRDLQVVICTAYSDYSWDDIQQRLGESDSLLILKKPFDNVEVLQMARALTAKWNVTRSAQAHIQDLDRAVAARTAELEKSEERFSKAFRNNPLAMFIQTLYGEKVLDANPSFLRLIKREKEEVIGRNTVELGIWAGLETADVLQQSLEAGDMLVRVHASGGVERRALLFTEHFDVGEEPCRLVLLQDVTERLKLEADLRQANKMEAIGQLAAGVAHDFNNILTIIQGHISLVLARNHLATETSHALNQALTASDRAGTLTRQLLAFSRKQVIERKPLTLSSLFEQVEAMLRRLIGEHVEIEMQCADSLPPVYADRCNIEQVVINLAVNARDAMPNGGKLTIRACHAYTEKNHDDVCSDPRRSKGNFICLSVADTGTGMDEATKSKIFEPFFTTKEVGKGTGMGLATVYGIVKQHQGWIDVESTVGKGTTFRVHLPVSVKIDDAIVSPKPAVMPANMRGHETILVVEDEQFLLEFVRDVLSSHGYRILSAVDATEALNLWENESSTIALLLTDMVMPGGVTGKQLAAKLKGEKPDLRIIFSSGYSLDLLESDAMPNGISILQKPYMADVLVSTVRDCLNAEPKQAGQLTSGWPVVHVTA